LKSNDMSILDRLANVCVYLVKLRFGEFSDDELLTANEFDKVDIAQARNRIESLCRIAFMPWELELCES